MKALFPLASRVTRHASRIALVVFTAAAIFGCATPRTPQQTASRESATLTAWQASGRIAVSGASAGGSGSFNWEQKSSEAAVQIRGPVGIGSIRLTMTDQALRIKTADGEEFVADDAEQELEHRLGAKVPAGDLRFWLTGIAAPGEHQWLPEAEYTTLIQHDWRIEYQRYGMFDGAKLPTKLVATSGQAKVRIVVDRWKVE